MMWLFFFLTEVSVNDEDLPCTFNENVSNVNSVHFILVCGR